MLESCGPRRKEKIGEDVEKLLILGVNITLKVRKNRKPFLDTIYRSLRNVLLFEVEAKHREKVAIFAEQDFVVECYATENNKEL